MIKSEIKALALEAGFVLKTQPDGSEDLHPYVYEFANAVLLAAREQRLMDLVAPDNRNSRTG